MAKRIKETPISTNGSFSITDFNNEQFIHCGNRNCDVIACTRNYKHIMNSYGVLYMIDFNLGFDKNGICVHKLIE